MNNKLLEVYTIKVQKSADKRPYFIDLAKKHIIKGGKKKTHASEQVDAIVYGIK
jgi:hypothetical protein